MHTDQLRHNLTSTIQSQQLLDSWRVRDHERGHHNLTSLAAAISVESLTDLCAPLARFLPRCADADMALNNLERFLANEEGARQLPALLEGRARILETLIQLFCTSQYFSDLLVANPDYLDMLRVPLRRSPSLKEMVEQLRSEVEASYEDSAVLRAFRRFRQKQFLRIGTNDIIRDRPLEEITRDLSRVADACLEVALASSLKTVSRRFGEPFTEHDEPARCAILAFGKHGGEELNYSSDIDLMFVYDEEGSTQGKRVTHLGNDEFFARVLSEVVRLLSAHTEQGWAYRVDLRLRPEGQRGPLARSIASTLAYYDTLGRTWERQALVKLRPVAGDLELGQQFLDAIEPFVYRKYLSFAEINGIKALKRRIEHKTHQAGSSDTNVKTGHGGIRDIEFTIQFLQLLNAGDLPALRQRNTLLAMQALERAGCLTAQEYLILEDAYRFLRKTEHRLQLLFDMQTHDLPTHDDELRKLALRMGYSAEEKNGKKEEGRERSPRRLPRRSVIEDRAPRHTDDDLPHLDPREAFLRDYRFKTDLDRKILDHLLHTTFAGDHEEAQPESDLLLDPHPDAETIRAALGRYPFKDVEAAYRNLVQLATETVPFLPALRCRHFLASIAPQLLRAVSETPDPDMALVNLEKVSASLGAKGILWELFSFNPPSLKLYVDLCAWSEFLSGILINNPGMIDELLDSLVLNQPRSAAELRAELAELCHGADDIEPILHSFQDKELLRIGVRDILGKDAIPASCAALSDLAETLLVQVAHMQDPLNRQKFGIPYLDGDGPKRVCRYAILGLGKLGGREMSYHSDLDLILVYEGDGRTGPPAGASRFYQYQETDHFEYFTQLARKIIKVLGTHGPLGQLYDVDMRLRPTGKSGSLVIPLAEFEKYYEEGAQLWERQALTRARVVFGDPDFGEQVMKVVARGAFGQPWRRQVAEEIADMRERLESSRSGRDLKRGFGGIVDVEFLVQLLQIRYAGADPALREPNTWKALDALHKAKLLDGDQYQTANAGFDFLRRVQGRLRIVQNRSQDELPEAADEVAKLARRLGFEGADAGPQFQAALEQHTTQIRELFLALIDRERMR
ncbi:MAG: bifunctional [glutamate--ammonia ligase]-adenylyl-L-tyrosine phosphorylase/[glutamate--ammonia-ligase] adenylyltransferase [Gemmataceae bacterium]